MSGSSCPAHTGTGMRVSENGSLRRRSLSCATALALIIWSGGATGRIRSSRASPTTRRYAPVSTPGFPIRGTGKLCWSERRPACSNSTRSSSPLKSQLLYANDRLECSWPLEQISHRAGLLISSPKSSETFSPRKIKESDMADKERTRIPATLIPGDGIGPEITAAVVDILDALGAPFDWDQQQGGMAAIENGGDPLPASLLDSIGRTKLALKGPLTTPVGGGFRSVNVRLREAFGLYANLRPVRTMVPGGRYEDIDIVLVRENLEGLYVAFEHYIP